MPFPASPLNHLSRPLRFPAGHRRPKTVLLPLLLGLLLPGVGASLARAASPLLESVKQNPALAKSLCAEFRTFNSQGLSATSPQAVAATARQRGLSPMDAEVLTTYVIGLHCPDVR